MTEQRISISSNEIQAALDEKIDVPDECICAYVRVEPYHLVRRMINPECTAHTPEDDGELEKERG
jgi:hypothetical protein